jgi:hypothetical protein
MKSNKPAIIYEHQCAQCNKIYSTYQSLWNHNKRYHGGVPITSNVINEEVPVTDTVTEEENYPLGNFVYLLSTENYKKETTYLVGRTSNLKQRLITYNRYGNYQLVYYKECKLNTMSTIKKVVIHLMRKCKIKGCTKNRFFLPEGKDISVFTNVIDKCVEFMDKDY